MGGRRDALEVIRARKQWAATAAAPIPFDSPTRFLKRHRGDAFTIAPHLRPLPYTVPQKGVQGQVDVFDFVSGTVEAGRSMLGAIYRDAWIPFRALSPCESDAAIRGIDLVSSATPLRSACGQNFFHHLLLASGATVLVLKKSRAGECRSGQLKGFLDQVGNQGHSLL